MITLMKTIGNFLLIKVEKSRKLFTLSNAFEASSEAIELLLKKLHKLPEYENSTETANFLFKPELKIVWD